MNLHYVMYCMYVMFCMSVMNVLYVCNECLYVCMFVMYVMHLNVCVYVCMYVCYVCMLCMWYIEQQYVASMMIMMYLHNGGAMATWEGCSTKWEEKILRHNDRVLCTYHVMIMATLAMKRME